MKSIIILSFLLLLLACNNLIEAPVKPIVEHKEIKNDSLGVGNNQDLYTQIKLTIDDSIMDNMPIKDASIYLARKYYNGITDTNFIKFMGVDYKSTTMIEEYGKVVISEINIRGKDISNATPKRCYLLYRKEKREAFFVDFSQLFLVKRKVSDTANIIGGIVITKGVGYFLAYLFRNSSFVKIFDSGFDVEDNVTAIPVYLNNGECIKYENDYLGFKNTDIDNDGFLDFSFDGTLLYYCKPNEYGIDITKRDPIKRANIKIIGLTR